MLGKMLGNMLVKPGQAPLFDNPANYGLDYENVSFTAKDGVTLKGWLIKGSSDKVIIQSHFGTYCARSGYTNDGKPMFMKAYPTEIKFLNQAKYLNEAGYTVLLYDFRGHGESGKPTKEMITWGPEESQDVVAAVDFIQNHETYQNANIGLLSICMGQGATIGAYGEHDLASRQNVKALISVQPLDFGCFMGEMGVPGFIRNSTEKYLQGKTGVDYIEASWRQFVNKVSVPTLVIQNKNDGYLNEDFVNGVYNDLQVEKDLLWIEIPKKKNANQNRLAAYEWIGYNSDEILSWFGKYV